MAIAVVYLLTAKLSLQFASVNPSATPIWPPTGLALGLTLLRGYRIWPAILAGAIVANLATSGWISLAIGAGNTLEALSGAWIVNALAKGVQAFRTPSGVGRFAAIVCAVATPISATTGVLSLTLAGYSGWSNFGEVWTTWWLGDFAGAVVVTPVLVLWVTDPPGFARRMSRTSEAVLVMILAAAVGLVAFGPGPHLTGTVPLAFLAILPLLWAALRCGERDTATVALILSAFAVWGAAAGKGPFIQPTLNDSFLLLVAFMVSAAVPSLALSASLGVRNRALASTEESHRLLVESVRDYAIFMLDTGGRVATWNSGAAQIYGYAADEIVGQHVARLQPDSDPHAGDPNGFLLRVAKAGKIEQEGWRVRRDGSQFWANIVVNAIRDPEGRLLGFAKVTRDVSERRQAEEALEHTREQLLQSQKLEALGQLTGGVAHDFNNLLMVVSGQADLLARGPPEERRVKSLDAIKAAVARGASLTRQLLSFARRQTLTPEVIELPRRLAAMQAMLNSSLGEAVELVLDLDLEVWPIEADANELELALINLAVNARDAMPEGGRLQITARNLSPEDAGLNGAFVALSVADTGIGMAPEILAKAFDPFFTTKPTGKGTGLGLSQVHGFALQSGGDVTAVSRPGEGCTVTLRLPRAQRAADPRPEPAGAEPLQPASGAVLLVEDNLDVAEVTSALLQRLGYRVVHESNAMDAIDRVEAGEPIDLVLSDITMPGPVNGLALARRIRATHPHLPMVLATGDSDAPEARDAGEEVLRKPFGIETLAAVLARALGRAASARAPR
ncbi:MASE1 domain-containing protein [Phenylobacterium sp.]|jgi:PAS domain S-box-containing protein|uniref:MASE1 domain-containing protein n=1 Tax=Phenylobacterium sp. TaxID=1871053 RepID=UPI002F3FABB5